MKLDLHSHILHGLDDGAKCIEESVELAKAMKRWGFERVTCTPHITDGYLNSPHTIRPSFERLKEELDACGVDLDIRMSAEYRLIPHVWEEVIQKNWIMPIEDKYVIMELPINKPEKMGTLKPVEEFKRIISMGLTPILPHPERYFYLSHKELMSYVEAGAKIQCNYGSLAGLYGEKARENVHKIIAEGIVSFYATDLHNAQYVEVLSDWFAAGNQIADYKG